jgi:hypothetical protein
MDKKLEDFIRAQKEAFDKTEIGKNKIAVENLIEKFLEDCKVKIENSRS